jgi:hypothetical protein
MTFIEYIFSEYGPSYEMYNMFKWYSDYKRLMDTNGVSNFIMEDSLQFNLDSI